MKTGCHNLHIIQNYIQNFPKLKPKCYAKNSKNVPDGLKCKLNAKKRLNKGGAICDKIYK